MESRGLEEFDDIAGGVLQQDLFAAWPFDDVVAKRSPGGTQSGDLRVDVIDNQVDAVPAPRSGLGAIRHGPPRGAVRSAEQQPQFAASDISEGRKFRQNLEAEELRIEGDRLVDVVYHIANADHVFEISHDLSSCHILPALPVIAMTDGALGM